MPAATFLLEGRAAAGSGRLWSDNGANFFAINMTENGSVDLRHRETQLVSDPGLVEPGDAYRLIYRSNSADGSASLEVRSLDRPGIAGVANAFARSPLLMQDFVPAEPLIRDFGGLAALANHNAPRADIGGLQVGTLVDTPAGPRPVETLVCGDVVLTGRDSAAIVAKSERAEAVTLGSTNAVRLRAPYFGLTGDVFVARHTQVLLSGPDIDYAFGTDSVTADAGDLVNHTSIMRDLSEPVRDLVRIELDRPGCLSIGRLRIAGAHGAVDCPQIDRSGAQALLAQTGNLHEVVG